jgi:hypothetical protein
MILPFSTQLNGKPTYFIEKIHKCFGLKEINMIAGLDPSLHYHKDYNFVAKDKLPAKLHTIREDSKDRWQAGTMIDFFINCRQPTMFRFAPRIPVVSIQEIEIKWIPLTIPLGERRPWVRIDGKNIFTIESFITEEMNQLAMNDGFDNVQDFFAYFNEDFKGKIIHWTNLKY